MVYAHQESVQIFSIFPVPSSKAQARAISSAFGAKVSFVILWLRSGRSLHIQLAFSPSLIKLCLSVLLFTGPRVGQGMSREAGWNSQETGGTAVKSGEGDERGWDSWMASPTPWTWVWASSVSWWWTGKPGMLQSTGSQGVRHDWVTELNWGTADMLILSWLVQHRFSRCEYIVMCVCSSTNDVTCYITMQSHCLQNMGCEWENMGQESLTTTILANCYFPTPSVNSSSSAFGRGLFLDWGNWNRSCLWFLYNHASEAPFLWVVWFCVWQVFCFVFLMYFFLLKDNCFTGFCSFLSNLNMNQP